METPSERVLARWRKHASWSEYNEAEVSRRKVGRLINELMRDLGIPAHLWGRR